MPAPLVSFPSRAMRWSLSIALVALAAACVPSPREPGTSVRSPRPHTPDSTLVELARAEPTRDQRALLVVYPRSACSGSARTVILDGAGTFLGAVGPGEAALLSVATDVRTVFIVSSVEITAPVGTSFILAEVPVAASPDGIILDSTRISTRQCGKSGQHANARVATKAELETALAQSEFQYVESRPAEGQVWIDAHRNRVVEVLRRNENAAP